DAPVHFGKRRSTADAIPNERLTEPAGRIDATALYAAEPDHSISAESLAAYEAAHGRIPDGAIVLINTGWSRFWPARAAYLGTAARGAEATAALRFSGLAADAARWLARERRVRAVAIDTASLDPGRSTSFEAH